MIKSKELNKIKDFRITIDNHLDCYGIPQGPKTIMAEFTLYDGRTIRINDFRDVSWKQ